MENKQYVGFWDRFHAAILTGVLLTILEMVFSYFIYDDFWMNSYDYFSLKSLPTEILSFIIVVYFWNRYMSDPGKMLFKANIVDASTYEKATLKQYMIRYIGYYLSLIPLGLGFWWVIWDKKKQAWHDKLAQTIVIKPKSEVKKVPWYIMLYRIVMSVLFMFSIVTLFASFFIPQYTPMQKIENIDSKKINSMKDKGYIDFKDLLYYSESSAFIDNDIEYIIAIYKKEVCTVSLESEKVNNKQCYPFKDMENLKVVIDEDSYVYMYDGSIYTDDYLNSEIYYDGNNTENALNEAFYIDEKDSDFKEIMMKLWKNAKEKDKK